MGFGAQKWAKNAYIFLELLWRFYLYVVDFMQFGGLVATGGIEPPTLGL
jgi:hypothetical protein